MINQFSDFTRSTLGHFRMQTGRAARFASRFNRAARYGWDMVLWSHLLGRKRDPIPIDFSPNVLSGKEIAYAPPTLHVSGPVEMTAHWDEGFNAIYAALLLNLQMPDELSAVRYAHPAPAFQGVYLWDSAFIAQVWKNWDPQVARDINLAVIQLRDEHRLQHVVADFVSSKYTQPPLLAWSIAAATTAEDSTNIEYLHQVFPALTQYHHWLRQHRSTGDHTFFWAHPYESGIDNSPRFSSRDESVFADTTALASPDFAAYMVLQCEALAEIAQRLDRPAESSQYLEEATAIAQAANQILWDDEHGRYHDWHAGSQSWIRSNTIASLLPLWGRIPSVEQAERLREQILDNHQYNTKIPLPSVARSDPDFSKDMWRGPVWINTAYGVIQGLERYGFDEEVADLAFRLCDGVYRTFRHERRLFEFYDPERYDLTELGRKVGNRWKQITLGKKPCAEFVGWTGLVNTLVIETLIGFKKQRGRRLLRPNLPASTIGCSFSVRLPAENLSIVVERTNKQEYEIVLRRSGRAHRQTLAVGQSIDIDGADSETSTLLHAMRVPIHLGSPKSAQPSQPRPLKICDITLSYTETSGGIRTYIDNKRKYLLENTNHEHILIIPDQKDSVEYDGRATTYRIESPLLPGLEPYRFFWRPDKIKQALDGCLPDVIELGSFYVCPTAAFAHQRERHRQGDDCVIAGYFHSDIADAYFRDPLREAFQGGLETMASFGQWLGDVAAAGAETYVGGVFKKCALRLAASPAQASRLREYGVDNVQVVPLGVDLERFHPDHRDSQLRQEYGAESDHLVLLYAGRLDSEKRVDMLVDAFTELPAELNAHLVIFGEGPRRDHLEARAKKLPRLHLNHYEKDKQRFAAQLASADIYVTAGPHETFGLSVVEAQASGLPTVGVRAGALVERVPKEVGQLAEVDDCRAFARAIVEVAQRRVEMSAAARKLVEEQFGWSSTFERLLELYRSLMPASRAQASGGEA